MSDMVVTKSEPNIVHIDLDAKTREANGPEVGDRKKAKRTDKASSPKAEEEKNKKSWRERWQGLGNRALLLAMIIVALAVLVTSMFFDTPDEIRYVDLSWRSVGLAVIVAATFWPFKGLREVGMVLVAFMLLFKLTAEPAAMAGIHKVAKATDKFVVTRSKEIEKHSFADTARYTYQNGDRKGEINPQSWFMTALGAAGEVRNDRRMVKAVNARANDEDEVIARAEVLGNQYAWTTVANLNIPTHITIPVTDMITPQWHESANADGNYWNPKEHEYDRTVLMYDQEQRGLPIRPGRLNELVGRFCSGPNNCGPVLSLGTDSVLCVGPDFHEGGYFQPRHNGLDVTNGQKSPIDFARGRGVYRLTIKSDSPDKGETFATDVCAAHPGAIVVKKP